MMPWELPKEIPLKTIESVGYPTVKLTHSYVQLGYLDVVVVRRYTFDDLQAVNPANLCTIYIAEIEATTLNE